MKQTSEKQTSEKQTLLMPAKCSRFICASWLVQIPQAGPEKHFLLLTEHAPG